MTTDEFPPATSSTQPVSSVSSPLPVSGSTLSNHDGRPTLDESHRHIQARVPGLEDPTVNQLLTLPSHALVPQNLLGDSLIRSLKEWPLNMVVSDFSDVPICPATDNCYNSSSSTSIAEDYNASFSMTALLHDEELGDNLDIVFGKYMNFN